MCLLHAGGIWLLVLALTHCTEYKSDREVQIDENTAIFNMLPLDETWKEANGISDCERLLMNSIFSKCTYKWQCRNAVHLEPIYFYPGDTVRIECVMCNLADILDGEPKRWARYSNISEFIENFGAKTSTLKLPELVQNVEDPAATKNYSSFDHPLYYQFDGFLVIKNANSLSQGVYFCFDKNSDASHRHFHILIPMVPVVHVASKKKEEIKAISQGCAEKHQNYPNHSRRTTFNTQKFDDVDTCFARRGHDDWECGDGRLNSRFAGCENPASHCRSSFTSDTLPLGTSLSISIIWSSWSHCRPINTHQKAEKRIGECFLKLDRPLAYVPKKWRWLTHLNALQRHAAFNDGVPLFSGLLASWLYGVEKLDDCLDTNLEKKHANVTVYWYNKFFTDVFKSINLTDASEPPKSAFKYCLGNININGTNVLYGTTTEDMRIC